MADNDELGVGELLLNEATHILSIIHVQGGIHFVQDVQWRGVVPEGDIQHHNIIYSNIILIVQQHLGKVWGWRGRPGVDV